MLATTSLEHNFKVGMQVNETTTGSCFDILRRRENRNIKISYVYYWRRVVQIQRHMTNRKVNVGPFSLGLLVSAWCRYRVLTIRTNGLNILYVRVYHTRYISNKVKQISSWQFYFSLNMCRRKTCHFSEQFIITGECSFYSKARKFWNSLHFCTWQAFILSTLISPWKE